ncbi:hypothetical protein V3G39_16985 [Dermatophilaceae bacterium Sec6.4]|nr:hypothetical protein [Actinomycetota bacterium]
MNAYDNDIETMLREAPAPDMGIDPSAVIAGAQRSVRRRRATVGAFGLAAALVIGATVGTTQLANHQSSTVPAQYGTSGPLGALFKDSKVGEQRFSEYIVSRSAAGELTVRTNAPGTTPLPRTGALPGGIAAFRDGQHVVVLAPLPRITQDAMVVFKTTDNNGGGVTSSGMRLSTGHTVAVFVTEKPATPQAVLWNVGADYFSSTGERGQVASFTDARVYWFPKLNVYGFAASDGGTSKQEPPSNSYLGGGQLTGGKSSSFFAAAVPRGARAVSVQARAGQRLNPLQIKPLGTSPYDVVYVTSPPTPGDHTAIVGSITWTDSTGRHTKSFS